jgi:SWI/SNF-related matrix-associated actin-dependent regulator 1 of chromatin subfamily A
MQLHPYQIEGVNYALKHRNTLIADEMGLGKTIQAIGYINANPEITTALIVCPLSLKLNWRNELATWLTCKERCTVTVVHYDALAKLSIGTIDLLVVDEAQYIKNPKTDRHQHIKYLSKRAKHVIMLTGTPFENKPIEIWPLLQILKPEVWDPPGYISKVVDGKKTKVKVEAGEGANFFTVAKQYFGAKKFTVWKKIKGKATQVTHWEFSGSSNEEEFKQWLRKTGMIRRLKKDVLTELPPKQRQLITLPSLESIQDSFGENISESNFHEEIAKLSASQVAFTEWSKKRAEQGAAKVELVVEHVQRCIENGSDKVILFAHHRKVIAELAEHLVWAGCIAMNAEMGAAERQDCVDIFNDDPNCKVIIGSFDIMGVGYNMNISDLVVFAEIDPVPGRMYQAEDRAHRFGKEGRLLCQYLVWDGTLEAKIAQIYSKKADVIGKVLG